MTVLIVFWPGGGGGGGCGDDGYGGGRGGVDTAPAEVLCELSAVNLLNKMVTL